MLTKSIKLFIIALWTMFLTVPIYDVATAGSITQESLSLDENPPVLSENDRRQRFLQATLAGVGAVTLWGVIQWDYFSTPPTATSEGWFAQDTKSGGADKLGHAYSTYVLSNALGYLYEDWGFTEKNAALYSAISSLAIMGFMELGDSFSEYGFSYEDMLANFVGAFLGYSLQANPDLSAKIDFRCEFGLEPNKTDVTTDYENTKFLLALKLNGFKEVKDTPWRHLEFLLGYYTRGYDDSDADDERNIFIGIGLNLTDLLYRNEWKKTATVLRYVQLPYTSINMVYDLD